MLGKNIDPLAARRQGVQKTASEVAVTSDGEPQKLIGVAEAKVLFVQYTNAKGEVETGMYFEVGGQIVATADTAEWYRKLHPMADWLAKQVRAAKEAAQPVVLPSTDTVDVIG